MENTYWNKQGQYQAQYDELVKLMPPSGPADTLAGELIRSVSRLGYDFYNNGMGNNTSGAANFLRLHGAISPEVYDVIYPFTRGRLYEGDYEGDELQVALERAVDETLEMITRNPQLMLQRNDDDMLSHEDAEERFYDEDEYDYYDDEEEYR